MIDTLAAPRLSGIEALEEAIATVPIPGAPPQLSPDGAAVGLAFLDVALRQNHIRRLTERLTLVEHRTARCITEVDISLGMLDAEQREAGLLYQRLRSHGAIDLREVTEPGKFGLSEEMDESLSTSSPDAAAPADRVMWVPISLARRTHAPIDVVGANRAKIPRLTQFETSRLLASAMYRLFRLILQSHPDAATKPQVAENGRPTDELSYFLDEDYRARWLIQAALVTLLTERNKPGLKAERPKSEHGEDLLCRRNAARIFKQHRGSLGEYISLLDLVVNEYLLVVALDPTQEEHLLAFDAPLHIELRPRRSLVQWIGMINGPYWVRYQTRVPANLRAYHLVAETTADLEIDTMSLRTDADESVVQSLRDDLQTLSDRLRNVRESGAKSRHSTTTESCGHQKVELELRACLVRLSELIRRRAWDASRVDLRLPRSRLSAAAKLAQAVTDGPASTKAGTDAGLHDHPDVTYRQLAEAAREIRRQGLGLDFIVENEPPGQRAHVYWRRSPSRVDSAQYINVSVNMFVRDISGLRSGSITAYVLSVVAISYTLASMRYGTPWPFGALFPGGLSWPWFAPLTVRHETVSNAAITVMLLVPGFLYTRLNLPQRHTIAGRLRRLPRMVAHLTIGFAAAVAVTFAAAEDEIWIQTSLALCMSVPLLSILVLQALSRRIPREKLPVTEDTPLWVRRGRGPDRRLRRRLAAPLQWRPLMRVPDSSFHTTSIEPERSLIARVVGTLLDVVLGRKRKGDTQ